METSKINLQGVSSQVDADKVLQALHEVWGFEMLKFVSTVRKRS